MTAVDKVNLMQREDPSIDADALVDAYARGPATLRAAVQGMTAEQAHARPIQGRWSTIELVAHLAGTELYQSDRIERTLAADRPLLMGVDERPYPERLNYQELDLGEQLDLHTALRRHIARVLRSQPTEAWARTAVHSESGLVTLRQLVFHPVRHLAHHLPFLAEKRAALIVPK